MKVVVISLPDFFEGEARLINDLLETPILKLSDNRSVPVISFHLRKPNSSVFEFENLLKQIKPELYKYLVIHDHFELVGKYKFRGVHLNSRNSLPPKQVENYDFISASCHSEDDLKKRNREIDEFCKDKSISKAYLFLSPIFDSISKKEYKSSFTEEDLKKIKIDESIYALGGVKLENLDYLSTLGFGGAGLLGEIWNLLLSGKKMKW